MATNINLMPFFYKDPKDSLLIDQQYNEFVTFSERIKKRVTVANKKISKEIQD